MFSSLARTLFQWENLYNAVGCYSLTYSSAARKKTLYFQRKPHYDVRLNYSRPIASFSLPRRSIKHRARLRTRWMSRCCFIAHFVSKRGPRNDKKTTRNWSKTRRERVRKGRAAVRTLVFISAGVRPWKNMLMAPLPRRSQLGLGGAKFDEVSGCWSRWNTCSLDKWIIRCTISNHKLLHAAADYFLCISQRAYKTHPTPYIDTGGSPHQQFILLWPSSAIIVTGIVKSRKLNFS